MFLITTALKPVTSLSAIKALVLDAVSSPVTKAMYGRALEDFFTWWAGQGRPAFTRQTVSAHRGWLEEKGYAPSTINQRLAAIRKLAMEAAAHGLLASDTAAGISQVPGARQSGNRAGNWLTAEQARRLMAAPDGSTKKGLRDRAALALLIGCGLRRAEAAGLNVADLQMRDGRWVIVDLRGKHGRIRTVPVPGWVKQTLDTWMREAAITEGLVLRSLKGVSISPNAVMNLVMGYGRQLGWKLTPHDLRRTCAKLCRSAGGELEQIQLLLGHASIQTTERYLGTRQNLVDAPNDRIDCGTS